MRTGNRLTDATPADLDQAPGAVVGTRQGVVAGLRLEGGGAAWRHVLDDGSLVCGLALGAADGDARATVAVVSGPGCSTARAFSARDGTLQWEVPVAAAAGAGFAGAKGALLTEVLAAAEAAAGGAPQTTTFPIDGGVQDPRPGLALAVGEDDSLSFVAGAEVLWRREEGLADIVDTMFVDLPRRSGELADEEPALALADKFEMEVVAAKQLFKLASAEEQAKLEAYRIKSSSKLRPDLDLLGFRKLILALTGSGKIYALHNGDGHVVWSRMLPKGSAQLVPWRSDPSMETAPIIAVLGRGPGAPIAWLNAHTGQEVAAGNGGATTEVLPAADQAFPLPIQDRAGTQAVLVVDYAAGTAHVQPRSAEMAELVAAAADSIFFYRIEARAVRGYNLGPPRRGEGPGAFAILEVWTARFHGSGGVVGHAAPAPEDPTFSQARVLGDRSVMYKYVNPNTLFLATADERHGIPWLLVQLLDTVTGRALYAVEHPEAKGPVRAVFCENWVVYQYWSTRTGRTQVSVLELYDDVATRREQSASEAVKRYLGGGFNRTVSSYAIPTLRVTGQSYHLELPAKVLGVTSSLAGMASRWVLFGTAADQVYALDKKFLDPRRPTRKPTKEDKEERLVPYSEKLPLIPHMYVTYGQPVAGLRAIATAPSRLESTSHLLAHGVDLFYTRVTPSKSFDRLEDDFSYLLLIVTMVALAAGCAFLSYAVKRDDLKRKWA